MDGLNVKAPVLDTAKVAGLIVVGSVLMLACLRKGFGGVTIKVGD